jgi:hypothetical protein
MLDLFARLYSAASVRRRRRHFHDQYRSHARRSA